MKNSNEMNLDYLGIMKNNNLRRNILFILNLAAFYLVQYAAIPDRKVICSINKPSGGFTYRILPANVRKLDPIIEEDAEMKTDIFSEPTYRMVAIAVIVKKENTHINSVNKSIYDLQEQADYLHSIVDKIKMAAINRLPGEKER